MLNRVCSNSVLTSISENRFDIVEHSSEKAAMCSSSIFTLSRSSAMSPVKRINILQNRIKDFTWGGGGGGAQVYYLGQFSRKPHAMRKLFPETREGICTLVNTYIHKHLQIYL